MVTGVGKCSPTIFAAAAGLIATDGLLRVCVCVCLCVCAGVCVCVCLRECVVSA